jgi:hypothetical protein
MIGIKSATSKEQQYLQEGLRSKRIQIQLIGNHLILARPENQSRHGLPNRNMVDMEHVRTLAAIRDDNDGEYLHPIVVFMIEGADPNAPQFLLADGFHRWVESKSRGDLRIRAYVVRADDPEREALLFAAMCNQRTLLKRTKADKEKAIRMVCSVPDCASWSDAEIAHHCGVGPAMASRVRKEYLIEARRDLPPAKTKKTPANKPAPSSLLPDEEPRPTLVGKPVKVAEDAPLASEAFQPPPTDFVPLLSTRDFKNWLLDRGVIAEKPAIPGAGVQVSGLLAGGRAIVLCGSTSVDDVHLAIGRALTYAVAAGPGLKATVVLVEQSAHRRIYAAAREREIEFLSPKALVADLLGEEAGEDDGA